MKQDDRIVRIARDLRELIKGESNQVRLIAYKHIAHALVPVLDELGEAGGIGGGVGLELNEYAQLKADGSQVAEQYGDSVDAGLSRYSAVDPDSD